jgi:hypothetical protein
MAATKTKRKNSTSAHLADVRAKKGKDLSPKWDGCESWDAGQYHRFFRTSMEWYRLEKSGKDLKPEVVKWLENMGTSKEIIKEFRDTKDSRSSLTMGAVAANLNRGMLPVREDFNNGRNCAEWLSDQIRDVIEAGKNDVLAEEELQTPKGPIMTIQDRLREASFAMLDEIEDALGTFGAAPDEFNPKQFKVLNLLKGKQAKAAHARIIRDYYSPQLAEYEEAKAGTCEQLKEGYSHISKKNLQKLIDFHNEIVSACEMLMQEAKVNKKPRAKKAKPVEKIVEKLKYCKANEPLKLVSINPTDIVGAKELWIFNVKTRKLGKYVAADFQELSVKGTSIINFNETLSVQKTLRKPEDQLKEFKAANKVALRKFLDNIKAVDIKLNGRCNEDTVLLKAG